MAIESRDHVYSSVNRAVLSMAAPVLASFISKSLARSQTVRGWKVVYIPDNHNDLAIFLQYCHYKPLPPEMTLDEVLGLLRAATKYGAARAIEEGKRRLEPHIYREPLKCYLWAAEFELEEEARLAALECARYGWSRIPELEEFRAGVYRSLLKFDHAYRGAQWTIYRAENKWRWGPWVLPPPPSICEVLSPGAPPFVPPSEKEWIPYYWNQFNSHFRSLARGFRNDCPEVCLLSHSLFNIRLTRRVHRPS